MKTILLLSCLFVLAASFPPPKPFNIAPSPLSLFWRFLQHFLQAQQTEIQHQPAILSSLYGYDGCIGGVNNFDTEEQYMEELKRRNCTVVLDSTGQEQTNVAPSQALSYACGAPITWLDGMPVTFNFPLVEQPTPESIEVELSDGSVVTPDCVTEAPANEANEQDTLLLIGEFGDGLLNTLYPVRVTVLGDVKLQGPDGELSAQGLSFSYPGDMKYLDSSVRMVYARLWDVLQWSEADSNLAPRAFYPNNCEYLFPQTSHIVRVAFSGGITLDGVTGVEPSTPGIFTVWDPEMDEEIPYLGLADLGNTVSGVDGELYDQDGDNYLDICLDLAGGQLPQWLGISLNCDPEQESVLYPPKGKPYGCLPDDIILTKEQAFGYYSMAWATSDLH